MKARRQTQSFLKKMKWRMITSCSLFSPALALADSNNDTLKDILNGLIDLLTSDIARVIFILSVIGVGYGWLYLGQIPKGRAIGAIVGIGIVFSAGWIAQAVGVHA